ncbi:MAG: metallophosphoesterase [Desulfovibrionales bacterium]
MFGTVLLSVAAFMHAYVFWRMWSFPRIRRYVSGRVIFLVGVFFWGLVVAGREYGHSNSGLPAVTLELVGMNWFIAVFLTFFLLLLTDLVTGFGFLFPKFANRLRMGAFLAGGVLSCIALVQGVRPPVVDELEIRISELPVELDGTVVVGMSDLHIGSILRANWLENRVDQVLELKPDLVVLVGDIFEGHDPPGEDVLSAMSRLSAPMGVWAVPGNHDHYHRSSSAMDLLQTLGIQVLANEWKEVRPGLIVSGVEDLTVHQRSGRTDNLVSTALENSPKGAAILLSHSPLQSEDAARKGIDLMLSGHTHAGQVWPFGYLVRMQYPLFEGLYDVEGMQVYVSRGAGTWGPRMRLWKPGEIFRITLRTGE